MADPISMMAVVGMGATIAGGGITAYGQQQSGKASKAMYDYRARIAQQNAVYEREVGERKAGEVGLQERARMGQITAAQGASGLDINRGTAINVREGASAVSRIEQEDVRYNAARRAYGEETQQKIYTQAGIQAKYAGGVQAAGTILGTVGSVASKWYQGQTVGLGYGGGGLDANAMFPV